MIPVGSMGFSAMPARMLQGYSEANRDIPVLEEHLLDNSAHCRWHWTRGRRVEIGSECRVARVEQIEIVFYSLSALRLLR